MCYRLGMENTRKHIKHWLKENRKRQYEFAADLGVTPEHFSRIMREHQAPSPTLRILIAAVTGLPVANEESWK